MTSRLDDRRFYIADLAQRLADMESGRTSMNALVYRVFAKRLRQAAAGFPDASLAGKFGLLNPLVRTMLENRHFDTHGVLRGSRAPRARAIAHDLFASLGVRSVQPVVAPRREP